MIWVHRPAGLGRGQCWSASVDLHLGQANVRITTSWSRLTVTSVHEITTAPVLSISPCEYFLLSILTSRKMIKWSLPYIYLGNNPCKW